MSPQFSESKDKARKKPKRKQVASRALLFFDPEDGGIFFRNFG
jgi:hypothetical protein